MRLTKKKAMEICIELWTYLEETGNLKGYWPEWEKYGPMAMNCPLCEYNRRHHSKNNVGCNCPLAQSPFKGCTQPPCQYNGWSDARNTTQNKKYAGLFLKQLKEIKWG